MARLRAAIDEVASIDPTELDPAEAEELAVELAVAGSGSSDTDTVAVTVDTGGSVLTLHLDEGSGSSAADTSPYGNDSVVANGDCCKQKGSSVPSAM